MDIQPFLSCLVTATGKKIVFIKSYLTGESNKNKSKIVNTGHCIVFRASSKNKQIKDLDFSGPMTSEKG